MERDAIPDFDKIHDGPGPYQKPCKQLLDGMPVELVADSLLRPILSTLKHYGDETEYDSHPVQQPIPGNSHYWAMSQQVETMRPLLDKLDKRDAWNSLALEFPDTLPDLANYLSTWSGSD